jgi:hypothetical protein
MALRRVDQQRPAVARLPAGVADRLLLRQECGGIWLLDANSVHAWGSPVSGFRTVFLATSNVSQFPID